MQNGREDGYYLVGCVLLTAQLLYEEYKQDCPERIGVLKEWVYQRALPAARAHDARRGFGAICSGEVVIGDELSAEEYPEDSECYW